MIRKALSADEMLKNKGDRLLTIRPSASMSTSYPTWLALGLNTGLRTANGLQPKDSTTAYLNA